MSDDAARQSSLGYLVDLWVQIHREAGRPDAELHRRDRDLARQNRWEADQKAPVLRRWLDALRGQGEPLPGRSVARAFGLLRVALAVLGLLSGWAAAAALLAYDGTRPVNVVHVLAVFVAAQILLLLLLGWVLVPYEWARRVPGAAALQSFLAWFSPGQLTRLAGYALPRPLRGLLTSAPTGTGSAPGPMGAVVKWGVVVSAQVFGVGFNVGALATGLYLVAFSDLAFAWSTTLQPDPARIHRLTEALSWPWGWLVPAAVPSGSLIRETLYYRQAGVPEGAIPAHWGQWWPFLVASMITYGLLPRCGLWLLAKWRFGRAVSRAFLELPGVAAIWDRLTSQWVTTQATAPETGSTSVGTEPIAGLEGPGAPPARELLVVDWGGIGLAEREVHDHLSAGWGRAVVAVRQAGGRASLEADAAVVREAAQGSEELGVTVLVKGWEPPVLEALDFVSDLRAAMGPRRLLVVCPVGLGQGGLPTTPAAPDLDRWERRTRARRDPALVVRGWPGGGGP